MLSGKTRSNNRGLILAILVLILASLYSVWPVINKLDSGIVSYGDSLLITWILNQNINHLVDFDFKNIFQGNIFYPHRDTLAFSDMFLPSSLISIVPTIISSSSVTAFNFSIIFSQVAISIVSFLFFRDITKSNSASLIGALTLALSQIRFYFTGHLQMWAMQWFILAIWMFWKYTKNYSKKYLILSAVFAGVQAWESLLPLYFILFSIFFLIIFERKKLIVHIKNGMYPLLLFLILTITIAKKYWSISQQYGVVRSIREAAHFSMSIQDFFSRLISPGLIGLLLISILIWRIRQYKRSTELYWFILIAITGFVMALGPVLKIDNQTFKVFHDFFVPLPYSIVYYIVPGFDGLRTPLRWIWLFAFGISGLVAVILSKVEGPIRKLVLAACFTIAVLGGSSVSKVMSVPAEKEYPNVYKVINGLPGEVMIELPMYSWGNGEVYQNEFWRMYFSLYHGKKLVNGASGFDPLEWQALQKDLWIGFPSTEEVLKLKSIGVSYIVVHKRLYDKVKLDEIEKWGEKIKLWEDNDNLVYHIGEN